MPDDHIVVREVRDGVNGWLDTKTGRWIPPIAGADGSDDGGTDDGAAGNDAGDGSAGSDAAGTGSDAGNGSDDGTSDGLGDAGKKALERERAARAQAEKDLKDAQARLEEIEDKDKTELQKETRARADAEKRAEAAEAKELRVAVAIKKKLPLDMADRLVGNDRDELEKDADKLLKVVIPATGSLDQGARGAPANKPKSMNDVVRDALIGRGRQ